MKVESDTVCTNVYTTYAHVIYDLLVKPQTEPFPFAVARRQAAGTPPASEAIFAATRELLRDASFTDLTVADILRRASISRTTFYRNFTSKHAVVSGLLGLVEAEFLDVMRPWFRRDAEVPEVALRASLAAVAATWGEHRPTMRASSEHWHGDPEIGAKWTAMMRRFSADIAKQIERERRSGAAPAGIPAEVLADHLVWGSERLYYLGGFGLFGPKLEHDAVEGILATWLGTIYGQVPVAR